MKNVVLKSNFWIEGVLKNPLENEDFFDDIQDGTLFCQLIIKVTGKFISRICKLVFYNFKENYSLFFENCYSLGIDYFSWNYTNIRHKILIV